VTLGWAIFAAVAAVTLAVIRFVHVGTKGAR
jgi:hypothetical protein